MRVNKKLLWLVPLALAGCKKNTVEVENATVEEVAAKVKEAGVLNNTALRPGQWQATIKLQNISAPGVPPEMEQQMRKGIGRAKTMTECLTEEMAKKPFERFVQGYDKSCRYNRFAMGAGKIDTKITCANNGLQREMTMQGSYTPETYDLLMDSNALGGGKVKRVNMTMSLQARRTGDCAKTQG